MHYLGSDNAASAGRGRARTLLACENALWLWPGIPLAMKQDGAIRPLPSEWVWFWIGRLHGFEAQHAPIDPAIIQAADHLNRGDEPAAQAALDAIGLRKLSPEGDALMHAVAARLAIAAPDIPVGTRSVPWGTGNIAMQATWFDDFVGAATQLQKAWDDSKHPRWPGGAPDRQGGRFSQREVGSDDSPEAQSDQSPGIGHNSAGLDEPPEIPPEEPPISGMRTAISGASSDG